MALSFLFFILLSLPSVRRYFFNLYFFNQILLQYSRNTTSSDRVSNPFSRFQLIIELKINGNIKSIYQLRIKRNNTLVYTCIGHY